MRSVVIAFWLFVTAIGVIMLVAGLIDGDIEIVRISAAALLVSVSTVLGFMDEDN